MLDNLYWKISRLLIVIMFIVLLVGVRSSVVLCWKLKRIKKINTEEKKKYLKIKKSVMIVNSRYVIGRRKNIFIFLCNGQREKNV